MENENETKNIYSFLVALLSISAAVIFGLIHVLWVPKEDDRLGQLLIQIIPSAIVVFVTFPIIYSLLIRRGIRILSLSGDSPEEIALLVAENLNVSDNQDGTRIASDIFELQNLIKNTVIPIEEKLQDLKDERDGNNISRHTNIIDFYTGTEEFLGAYLDNVKDDDQLIIIDTFIDNVVVPKSDGEKLWLYDKLERMLHEKPSLQLSIIAVAYSKNARLQMLSRAFLSQEGKAHLYKAQEFWAFVSDTLLENFPERVSIREINFLPCISAFAVESRDKDRDKIKILKKPPFSYCDITTLKNSGDELHLQLDIGDPKDSNIDDHLNKYYVLTKCRDIYYSLMAAGSSHQCDYFHIKCNRNDDNGKANNYSHEKRLIEYINQCWLLGTKFDKELWDSRQEEANAENMPVFSKDQENLVNKWGRPLQKRSEN